MSSFEGEPDENEPAENEPAENEPAENESADRAAPNVVEARRSSLARAGFVLAVGVLFFVSLASMVGTQGGAQVHNNDFKHLWAGSRILIEGGSPYDPELMFSAAQQYGLGAVNPFVYLPATGLILSPFAAFEFSRAQEFWFWLNWLVAWACVGLGPFWLKLPRPRLAVLAGALFLVGSLPFYRQMTAGQMNVAILLALVASLGFFVRGWRGVAGAILGVAAAFKIAPLVFLFPLVCMRRWRAVVAFGASFAALNLAAVLWFGVSVHADAFPVLSNMGFGKSTWAQFGNDFYRDPFNQSFNALFHHLFTENPHTVAWMNLGESAANGITMAVSLTLLAGLALTLLRYNAPSIRRVEWGRLESQIFLISTLLMLLLPSLMWDHYAVQTLIVLMWLFGANSTRSAVRPAIGVFAFLLLTYPVMHTNEAFRSGAGILVMSVRLWGTLLLLGLLAVELRAEMKRRIQQPEI